MKRTKLTKAMLLANLTLSATGKMPCYSWSLEAITTCAGSKKPNGELVDACSGCYATTGFYLTPVVRNPRVHNKSDWKRTAWASDMTAFIETQSHFRWFDSGDVYSIKLAEKILEIMTNTPNCKHWLPTRMHKFKKFAAIFDQMNALPNVVVRFSSDSIHGDIIAGDYTSTIIEHADDDTAATVCDAYKRKAKCGDCRACWDKDVKVIAYPQHGKKMAKINIEVLAA